jgi:hypothetical protein
LLAEFTVSPAAAAGELGVEWRGSLNRLMEIDDDRT